MAATPNSLARAKVAAVVKADWKRGSTGNSRLAILRIRASGYVRHGWLFHLHATAPKALLYALGRDRHPRRPTSGDCEIRYRCKSTAEASALENVPVALGVIGADLFVPVDFRL